MKSDKTYLKHILKSINIIEEYINDIDYVAFANNQMMIDAVIRNLEIIGEASNNLSAKIRAVFPNYTLQDPIDMRNFLIHEYFGVRHDIVWGTCKKNLPELKIFIEKALKEHS